MSKLLVLGFGALWVSNKFLPIGIDTNVDWLILALLFLIPDPEILVSVKNMFRFTWLRRDNE